MRIRDKALRRYEEKVDADKVTPKDLLVTVGILTDKVRLVTGQSSPSEKNNSMPLEQVRELFAGFAKGVVEAAQQRDSVISSSYNDEDAIDAEYRAIPDGELMPAERS